MNQHQLQLEIKTDSVLEAEIKFNPQTVPPINSNKFCFRSILLTGATGFLGNYLLFELMQKTSARIYCLVREKQDNIVINMIKKNMQQNGIWHESFRSRIYLINGDLSLPELGMSSDIYHSLSRKIDAVYHNGAIVNNVFPYSKVRKTNVVGTKEILKFASCQKTKPLNYVSSMGIFLSPHYAQSMKKILEKDIEQIDHQLKSGYLQSKMISEILISKAKKRGLPACIFRPVRILGNSKNGTMLNNDDFMFKILKSCICMGKYPDFDVQVNFIPVDFTAKAIVSLSLEEKNYGEVFHLTNPHSIAWEIIFERLENYNFYLKKVSYPQWFASLKELSAENQDYLFLMLLMGYPNELTTKIPSIDAENTLRRLSKESVVCPEINAGLMHKFLLA